jgi:hypothetical protein
MRGSGGTFCLGSSHKVTVLTPCRGLQKERSRDMASSASTPNQGMP